MLETGQACWRHEGSGRHAVLEPWTGLLRGRRADRHPRATQLPPQQEPHRVLPTTQRATHAHHVLSTTPRATHYTACYPPHRVLPTTPRDTHAHRMLYPCAPPVAVRLGLCMPYAGRRTNHSAAGGGTARHGTARPSMTPPPGNPLGPAVLHQLLVGCQGRRGVA